MTVGQALPELSGFHLGNLFDKRHLTCAATTDCTWVLERTIIGSLTLSLMNGSRLRRRAAYRQNPKMAARVERYPALTLQMFQCR